MTGNMQSFPNRMHRLWGKSSHWYLCIGSAANLHSLHKMEYTIWIWKGLRWVSYDSTTISGCLCNWQGRVRSRKVDEWNIFLQMQLGKLHTMVHFLSHGNLKRPWSITVHIQQLHSTYHWVASLVTYVIVEGSRLWLPNLIRTSNPTFLTLSVRTN